ncbi:hypothetical protein RF11_13476 [Thelohanellus kitauei]|uniref:Uncharacterized protein n=1 Tax=Thelohanellus kitauei TaxID=669202 RepID=A0A0C2MLI2_THEKT|nr:hypothetical protein RF11_13476 [Thelohanellus kitauei]
MGWRHNLGEEDYFFNRVYSQPEGAARESYQGRQSSKCGFDQESLKSILSYINIKITLHRVLEGDPLSPLPINLAISKLSLLIEEIFPLQNLELVLTRIAHKPLELGCPVETSDGRYNYQGVREVVKPLHGLNVDGCVRKLLMIAEKIRSCRHMISLKTTRAINYSYQMQLTSGRKWLSSSTYSSLLTEVSQRASCSYQLALTGMIL